MVVSAFITLLGVKDGDNGKPGSDGKTNVPSSGYALIYENTEPDSSTIWKTELPTPWFLGLEYWSRVKYTWSDGSVSYSAPSKCIDANTLMQSTLSFTPTCTPETYERNLRDTAEFYIILSALSSSYQNASISWLVNGERHNGDRVTLSYRKNTAPPSISVKATLSYTRAGRASTLEEEFKIESIDTTEYTKCYGVSSTEPSSADIIEGDCYVRKSGADFFPMVYSNSSWVEITAENMSSYPDAMSKCGNAVVLSGGDIPKTSAALHAYFSSLFAKSANIDFISTQDIQIRDAGTIRSTGKEEIGDGKSGFIIKSDGTSEFVGAVIRNADLSETRIERLDADVLRTVNETLSGDNYTGKLAATPYWNLGAAVQSAMGKSTQNAVSEKAGSIDIAHAEGDRISASFSAALYVTSEEERTKERSLYSVSVDGSSAGTAFSIPALPARVQSSIKLGGTGYIARITATGASARGTKQYSVDGGAWTDYDSIEFSYEAIKGKTIKLRQLLSGGLYDTSGCTRSKAGSTSTDTMPPCSAIGGGRMVISNTAKIISFPIENPSSVSTFSLSKAYPSVYGLAYGNGIFLAVVSGSVQSRVLSGGSAGTSWSELSSEGFDNLFFANGYFYAHRMTGGTSEWVRSTDGRSWSDALFACADPFLASNSVMNSRFAYGNGTYIQVCSRNLNATGVYVSSNGNPWNLVSLGASNLASVGFQNGLFIAHERDTGTYFISGDNGVTWSRKTHSNIPSKLAAMSSTSSAFYGTDCQGYIYKIPIVAGTPTASTAGTLTVAYNYKRYQTGLNLLDAAGKNLVTLRAAESYYTGSFSYSSENLVSALPFYYKFGGIYKGNAAVAAGSFDMFASVAISWSRIYNAKDSYSKSPSVITWSGTSLTIVNSDNTASRIRSNDLFSALSITFRIISEAKGAYTKDIYPQESGKYDIGSATKKYDQIHANEFHGKLVGDVQGNLTGSSTGTHTGNVNSEGTTNKVWGAVWN